MKHKHRKSRPRFRKTDRERIAEVDLDSLSERAVAGFV